MFMNYNYFKFSLYTYSDVYYNIYQQKKNKSKERGLPSINLSPKTAHPSSITSKNLNNE